jgi:hypothetical protein
MAYGGPIDRLILAQVAELVVRHSERDAEREVVPHFRISVTYARQVWQTRRCRLFPSPHVRTSVTLDRIQRHIDAR